MCLLMRMLYFGPLREIGTLIIWLVILMSTNSSFNIIVRTEKLELNVDFYLYFTLHSNAFCFVCLFLCCCFFNVLCLMCTRTRMWGRPTSLSYDFQVLSHFKNKHCSPPQNDYVHVASLAKPYPRLGQNRIIIG